MKLKGQEQIEVPKIAEERPAEEKGKGLKQLWVTLLFLTIGLLAIILVGDYLLRTTLPTISGAEGTESIQQQLRDTGFLMVYALGGLTGLVFLSWLVARRSSA